MSSFGLLEETIFGAASEQGPISLSIEGSLPSWLRGTCYLNGPARFRVGNQQRCHWLDGDGLVRRLGLADGVLNYRSRYVRTTRYLDETEAGSFRFRSFDHAFPGDLLRNNLALASPANVSAYMHGDQLLVFGEQSLPWALDPDTLETRSEVDFGGQFKGITPFAAHPKTDDIRQELATFGLTYFGNRATLQYYLFDRNLQLVTQGRHMLKKSYYIHDFALCDEVAVFHAAPYLLDIKKVVKGGTGLMDALSWQPDAGMELIVFSRRDGKLIAQIPLAISEFCLHVVNARMETGRLLFDYVASPEPFFRQYRAKPAMFEVMTPCSVNRMVLNLENGILEDLQMFPLGFHMDFPSTGMGPGSRCDRFWALGMGMEASASLRHYNRLISFDYASRGMDDCWESAHGQVLGGEPVVVHNGDETVVFCQMLDLTKKDCALLFFDGKNLAAGPRARVNLPFFDPPGFHTSFKS